MQKQMIHWEEKRLARICREAVKKLKLDLSGLKVVTEAANGLYAITPLIAELAGAKQVVCLGKDTSYGTFQSAAEYVYHLADIWELPRPTIVSNRLDDSLKGADIITNLGMVRPLDATLLDHIGGQAVIPYMFEAWEFRPADIDLEVCKRLGIPIMGTDENHPTVDVFRYCGLLAIKMVLEAGFEVLNNKIAVVSSDQFGPVIASSINNCGGMAELFSDYDNYYGLEAQQWDVIIIAEYLKKDCICGTDGLLCGDRLEKIINQTDGIIQFAGRNEVEYFTKKNSLIYPEETLPAFKMARTLAYLGPWPIALLNTAGLLVGATMAQAKKRALKNNEFQNYVTLHAPAQPILIV